MKAMILKEFRQMRRDRRTVALMVGLPIMLLIVFGYAARFDVTAIRTAVLGPGGEVVTAQLPETFEVVVADPNATEVDGRRLLRDSEAAIAIVTGPDPVVLIDGTELFVAQSALRRIDVLSPAPEVEILFNPDLKTSWVMIPAIIGLILGASGGILCLSLLWLAVIFMVKKTKTCPQCRSDDVPQDALTCPHCRYTFPGAAGGQAPPYS